MMVKNTSINGIWADHPDGPVAAVDAAVKQITPRDPGARRYVTAGGTVIQGGRDPGGHLARRAARGDGLRELTASEIEAHYRGETITHA